MIKYKTKKNMLTKASSFLSVQNLYLGGHKSDAEMTEITTQPFWQSMHLSKKRLWGKGLVSETIIAKSLKPMTFISDTSNSHSEIGTFTQPIKEHKRIYSKGQIIYNKRDDKIIFVSAIKANGDEENACCPNCGNLGKISSYIDGCDYCGSKFTVNDFEEKISSFSLEENTPKKVLNVFKYIALVVGILAGAFSLLSVVSIIFAIIMSMSGASSTLETLSLVIFMIATELSPIFGRTFIYTGILFIIILILAFKLLGQRIGNTKIIKSEIQSFSPEDFAQNLEFKLRNIHFASNAKEVNVYSKLDLGNAVVAYQDVIECTLSKLTFKNVRKLENTYYIDADLICALTKYRNEKVWVESEKVSVTMSAPESLQDRTLGSIHCYYCPNCSSTINLLNGGVCDYCGTKLDYSKHGWMFEHYESKGKVANPFTKIKWLLLAVYAGIFIVFSAITLSLNYDTIYQLSHFDECVDICHYEFDSVSMMHEIVPGVLPLTGKNDATQRMQSYYVDAPNMTEYDAVKAYCEYLSNEGFHLKDVSDTSYTYYRIVSYPEVYLEGHFELEINYDVVTGEIVVDYYIDDSPYEE